MKNYDYIHDGSEIYRNSFAIIRREANLAAFSPEEEKIVVRMIHACGMVDLVSDILISPTFAHNAKSALKKNAAILCDANMVAHGVTRARLPANNPVICTLKDEETAKIAKKIGNTRSAAALDLWGSRLEGAVVAIGNAPTALFRLLELLETGAPKPAAIIGMPVGFVGAAESKEALAEYGEIPFIIVKGRKGGSAMAAAVVNALASEIE
ncbi:MAG: precorrin-8X methylmutase [Methylocystaceae bacterium]|jgi:precorrin-8X/cobalt-precorrin-8 methylmutase|nr:precorrin-8X methylmutase [Methylocystaceae bacterium]NBT97090.1 precorrin-8X methylmutase [Methylocystaceae bacterium]